MDLTTFVRTLEPHVFRILLDACTDRLNQQAKEIPLMTNAERELASVSRVKAIRCVRGRTGLGLLESKAVVDREVPPEVTIVRSPGDDNAVVSASHNTSAGACPTLKEIEIDK